MSDLNVLWICTDQQRFDTLGVYGNPLVRTPHLDRLAREGTLFENCFSQSPVCTPSRAAFLTGRYPCTTRCRQNGQILPAGETLITKRLADAGYVCGLAGKLHLAPCCPSACPAMEQRGDDGYAVFHWSHHPADDWPGNEYSAWLRERGAAFAPRIHPRSPHVRLGPPGELSQAAWCAEKAIDFMGRMKAAKRPWLFSLNCFDPHHEFDPPEEYLAPYLDRLDQIPLPNFTPGELADKPRWQRLDHQGAYGGRRGYYSYDQMTDLDHRLIRAAYWAMCDLIDVQVGRLLAALEETGQADRTLVIFTSDHGEMLGDHGLYLKGTHFYDPAVKVPLILRGPGVPAGRRISELVELFDLAPTVMEAAGQPRPAGMQARSLWPLLNGQAGPAQRRESVFCEFYNGHAVYEKPVFATMVRTADHKLVAHHGEPAGELYDLRADPNETRNLWNEPGWAELKAQMLGRLCDRMAETVDPLPARLAGW